MSYIVQTKDLNQEILKGDESSHHLKMVGVIWPGEPTKRLTIHWRNTVATGPVPNIQTQLLAGKIQVLQQIPHTKYHHLREYDNSCGKVEPR